MAFSFSDLKRRIAMAKEKKRSAQKPERVKLSAKEILKRMQEFPKRKERIVAAVRKGKNRSVSA
jgi:hypothetical protein